MTAQLSREEIEAILKQCTPYHANCISPVSVRKVQSMARMLLAGMDSEPVGEVVLGDYDDCGDYPDAKVVCIAAKGQADWNNFSNGTKLYAAPPAPVAGVDDDVRNIIGLLETNEWAEHCTSTVLGSRLESEITRLVGEKQPTPVAVPDLKELEAILDWILMLPCPTPKATHFAKRLAVVIDRCRAAMLKEDGTLINEDTKPVTAATVPDGLASSVKCWCHTCRPVTITDMRFVVCPDCGNKRCPKANDHSNACSGSNEPGQVGSAYPAAPEQEV